MLESAVRAKSSAQKIVGNTQRFKELSKTHGRAIFVYSNIYTNQVVYSLERTMNNAGALKQLVYTGKNSVPRALRKDMWRPLCTVLFPDGDQGRHAFQKLREWRRLHEVSWDKSELPESKKEPARGTNRIGGPRFRRTDTNLRKQKMIQDQKAASIADLAAVLAEQDRIGEINAEHEVRTRQALSAALLPLADLSSPSQIADLEKQIADLGMQQQEIATDKSIPKTLETTITTLERELTSRRHVAELLSTAPTSTSSINTTTTISNTDTLTSILSTLEPTTMWRMHQERQMAQRYSDGQAQQTAETSRRLAIRESRRLARQPTVLDANLKIVKPPHKPSEAVVAPSGPVSRIKKITAYTSGIMAAIRRGPPRVYSSQGVEIKWTNPLDAEFAAEWPRDVVHGPMGYARYTAPPALARKPRMEVKDGLFDVVTGKFVGAASLEKGRLVQRFNREKSWQAELAAKADADHIAVEQTA